MAVKVGRIACVAIDGKKIAEIGTFTLSGFTRDTLESTEFGDDIKEYVFGMADGGEVSFSGNYDHTDSTGQMLLESYVSNNVALKQGQLRFYLDTTTYFTVGTDGTIIITKCKAISFEKAGIGTIEFTGKVAGAEMYLVSGPLA